MGDNKGITLVALVVTIIVLLILAGVTISLVLGQNGIIGKAQSAQTETEKAEIKEQVELAVADVRATYILDKVDINTKTAADILNEVKDRLKDNYTIGEVTEVGDAAPKSANVTINGYTVTLGSDLQTISIA